MRRQWMRIRWLARLALAATALAPTLASAQIFYVTPGPPDGTFPTTVLRQVNPDGSGNVAVPTPGVPLPQAPTLSQDNRFIGLVSRNPFDPLIRSQSVFELDRATGLTRLLLPFQDVVNPDQSVDANTPMALAYAPDNQRVAVAVETIFGANTQSPVGVISVEVRDRNTGLITALFNGATQDGIHTAARGIDWSPSGVVLAIPQVLVVGPSNVASVTPIFFGDPNTGNFISQLTTPVDQLLSQFPLVTSGEHDYAPAISPSGTGLAYFRARQTRDTSAPLNVQPFLQTTLRIIGTNGTNDRAIVALPPGHLATRVDWSPDGTQLVFDAGPRATLFGFPILQPDPLQLQTFRIDVDGTDLVTLVGAPAISPAWASGSASSDSDGDGVPDDSDNCVDVSNSDQADANASEDDDSSLPGIQSYGDACDADLDNDGTVGPSDFFTVLRPCLGANLATRPECLPADFDGDGNVGPSDFFGGFRPALGTTPGPGVTL